MDDTMFRWCGRIPCLDKGELKGVMGHGVQYD